jgi:hypothetical protein
VRPLIEVNAYADKEDLSCVQGIAEIQELYVTRNRKESNVDLSQLGKSRYARSV